MKITTLDLRRELAVLDGWTEMEPCGFFPPDIRGTNPDGMKHQIVPDYPDDPNACFKLARKLGFEIELTQYDVYSTATVTNPVLAWQGWAMEDDPGTAAALAILSAHRGERMELEDANG